MASDGTNGKRALLIDASNNFIRHYMVNSAATSNSVPAGGTVGLLNTIKKAILTLKPEVVYCIWDGENGSIQKRQLLKEYKEGRKARLIVGQSYQYSDEEKAEKNKEWQRSLAHALIELLPVCQIVTDGYEADDAIGYICKNKAYYGIRSAIILSSDKDFYQLLNLDRVVIYNPIKKDLVTTKTVLEREEIHPMNWLFYRTVVGDKSDNIKGIHGIGPKKMKKLFDLKNKEHNPDIIEDLLEAEEDKWKKKTLQKLQDNIEIIDRNWSLMNLTEPMMSTRQGDLVDAQVSDFSPSLRAKDLYLRIMKEGIPIQNNISSYFHSLV